MQQEVGSPAHRADDQPSRDSTAAEMDGPSEEPAPGMQSSSFIRNINSALSIDDIVGNITMLPIIEDPPQNTESLPEVSPTSKLNSEVPSKINLETNSSTVTRQYNLRSLHKTPAHKNELNETVGGLSTETSKGTSIKGRGRKSLLSKAQVKAKYDVVDGKQMSIPGALRAAKTSEMVIK